MRVLMYYKYSKFLQFICFRVHLVHLWLISQVSCNCMVNAEQICVLCLLEPSFNFKSLYSQHNINVKCTEIPVTRGQVIMDAVQQMQYSAHGWLLGISQDILLVLLMIGTSMYEILQLSLFPGICICINVHTNMQTFYSSYDNSRSMCP